MAIKQTTVRWKLHNDVSSLTGDEIVYLSDLVTEKLGYKAPTEKEDVYVPDDTKGQENLDKIEGDEYPEVFKRSPNQSGKIRPKYIVLHDSYGSHDGTRSWILQRRSGVSYHYLIDKDGSRTQFVGDTNKAWHAGKSSWKGLSNLNAYSIGIAFSENTYDRDATDAEIDSAAKKCIYLMKKFNLGVDNIITHQMIAPERKNDTSPQTHERVVARVKELLDE